MGNKNSLEILFGSRERWRAIKMFLLNEEMVLTVAEIAQKIQKDPKATASVARQLVNAKFLSSRKKSDRAIYFLNKKFPFIEELKKLVIRSNIFPQCDSLSKIKNLGNVKLAIVTGVFINEPKVRTDLLIVGDNISRTKMKNLLGDLEAELGREVDYSLLGGAEFKYRTDMFDKFIMEIFESPHEVVVNKIPGEIQQIKRGKK